MDITAQRVGPASAFRVPITLLIVAALLGVALFAIAVASQPHLPAPFGPGSRTGGSSTDRPATCTSSRARAPSAQLLLGGARPTMGTPTSRRQGDKLTVPACGGDRQLRWFVMRPDGSERATEVAGPLVGLDWPAWSADGTRIAFTQRPGRHAEHLGRGHQRPAPSATSPSRVRPRPAGPVATRATPISCSTAA